MLFKGFRFGLLLQLAVGPVCLAVFQTAASGGLLSGLLFMAAAALTDALYIALSTAGAAALLGRARVRTALKYAGGLILALFGLDLVLGASNLSFMPDIALFSGASAQGAFVRGLIVTASNPMTILFWSGVFSARTAEGHWAKRQLFSFAAGCVLATICFLSAVALAGRLSGAFLPSGAVKALNAAVGLILALMGARLAFKKEKTPAAQGFGESHEHSD